MIALLCIYKYIDIAVLLHMCQHVTKYLNGLIKDILSYLKLKSRINILKMNYLPSGLAHMYPLVSPQSLVFQEAVAVFLFSTNVQVLFF